MPLLLVWPGQLTGTPVWDVVESRGGAAVLMQRRTAVVRASEAHLLQLCSPYSSTSGQGQPRPARPSLLTRHRFLSYSLLQNIFSPF